MIDEVNANYIKGHYKWLQEQELTNLELEEDVEHNARLIKILEKRNVLNADRLRSNNDYVESVKSQFKVWCSQQEITASELIELI